MGPDRALTHPAGGCRTFSACLSGGGQASSAGLCPAYYFDGTEPHLYIAAGQSPTATIVILVGAYAIIFFSAI